jgi:hypothetical protein
MWLSLMKAITLRLVWRSTHRCQLVTHGSLEGVALRQDHFSLSALRDGLLGGCQRIGYHHSHHVAADCGLGFGRATAGVPTQDLDRIPRDLSAERTQLLGHRGPPGPLP